MAKPPEQPPGPWSPRTRSEETRTFYQERLAFFFKVMFVLYLVFISVVIAAYALFPHIKPSTANTQNALGAFGILILAFIWRLRLRKKPRSIDELFYLDTTLVVVIGINFGIDCYLSFEHEANMWSCFIWTSFMVFARVLYVPSTARRTAVLSSLAVGPVFFGATAVAIFRPEHLSVPPAVWSVGSLFYGIIAVVLATIGSKVIYGLRRQVQEAKQLGQYTLGRKIGEGGMGAVFEAKHAMLRRPTAIKLLPPHKAGSDALERFEREVQITAELSHPNTVAVYDYGRSTEGIFYYAMEYLDGVDLDTLVRIDGPQKPSRVVHILTQASGALQEAHGKNLIHRDIKPANIFLCELGGVPDFTKVLDFGLVKEISDSGQTTGSLAAGTPAFISPEAVMGTHAIGPPADIYGLGAVAYFLLSGRPVFEANNAMEMCVHHARSTPEPLHKHCDTSISQELEAIVMSCLAKDPNDRPQSAAELHKLFLKVPEASLWTEGEASRWWNDVAKEKIQEIRQAQKHEVSAKGFSMTVQPLKTPPKS